MNDKDLMMSIAGSKAWSLSYGGVMPQIVFKNGETLSDRAKKMSPELPDHSPDGTYPDESLVDEWRIQYQNVKDQVKVMIEEHVKGSDIHACYDSAVDAFYNGSEDDHMFWAEDAGFDPGPRSDDEDYDDLKAYRELAFEFINGIMWSLDWDSIPREWLVGVLRSNDEDGKGDFYL